MHLVKLKLGGIMVFAILFLSISHISFSQDKLDVAHIEKVDVLIRALMNRGDIPGLSVVIIKGDQKLIRNYGYATIATKAPVTSATLFEIGSCSKAFTSLAIAQLMNQNKINLNDEVSDYLPWLRVTFEGKPVSITLGQLLHHTSGIPWETISKIPESNSDDALEQTVRKLIAQELESLPGKEYEYATINYDVLALVIEIVAKQSFENYVQENVIRRLGLTRTTIGKPFDKNAKATGYKIGFLSPREYEAPIFKGNNAAGYVISNAEDMASWLTFQMGLSNSDMYDLALRTHQRDETVPLHGMSSYASGWHVSLDGTGEIYHEGVNPNFTSYIVLRPEEKIGIAVLANSNSTFTPFIGDKLMKLVAGEEPQRELDPGAGNDKTYSGITFAVAIYILVVIGFIAKILIDAIKARRKYEPITLAKLANFGKALVIILPFIYGFYILPQAIAGFSWEAILVWSPISFAVLVASILIAMGLSYFAYFLGMCFPEENQYKRKAPLIIVMGILSGLSNVVVIIMVTSAIHTDVELKYLLFYYTLTLGVYLLGRRFVQVNLIRFTRGLVYDMRIQLIDKIFSTSYQKFEAMDRGRVYTALNDDVNTIGQSTNLFAALITSIITAIGAFVYLASIAFWATLLTIFLILTLSAIYYIASQSTNSYFEKARDERNVFMRLISGMIEGFKEISLHRNKKLEYKSDIAASAHEYKEKTSIADIRFVNAFLIGESLLVVLLGTVSFGMPKMFPSIEFHVLMSFVVILLYLMGPINAILGSVPAIMQLKISWNRIKGFMKDVPVNLDLNIIPNPVAPVVESIRTTGIKFQYKGKGNEEVFSIGPIDLEVNAGEIVFIIGGNGSGKSTLAKLLTGLYEPDEGCVMVNNEVIKSSQIGEYFSAVFSPAYLFEKLYSVDVNAKQMEVKKLLKLLHLDEKVGIDNNKYSTIDLSGGQRKRLALLQCYLEDSPIYLFDEWAADQDPDYRNFFYRTLLPEMKAMGKIIIAITHDDHYFDVADKVLKMNQGKLETYSQEFSLATTN